MRSSQIIALLSSAFALAMSTQASAQEQQLPPRAPPRDDQAAEFFTEADFQRGDYGTDTKVETISTTVGVALRKGRVRLGAAIPYLRTTAPVDVVVSQGGLFGTPILASGSNQTVRSSREGLGDATLQVAYDVPLTGFDFKLGGGLKLPTASRAKGLGTGKVDYALNAQVARALSGGIMPFAAIGYSILGKPEGFAVRNTVSATAGARLALSSASSASLSYTYDQSASKTLTDRQAIGLGLGVALGSKLQLGLHGEAGLSRGAPDMKLGLRLGVGL